MKYIILLILTFNLSLAFTQNSTEVNQRNDKGKKIGLWEVKVDAGLCPTKKEDFKYIVYNSYDSLGNRKYKHFCYKHRKDTLIVMLDSNFDPTTKLLSGTFTWINSDGTIDEKEVYKNGLPIYYEAYYYSKNFPKDSDFIYFDSLWNNIPNTHVANYVTDRDTSVNYYHYTEDGWKYSLVDDTTEYIQKYPYFKDTPPLLGLIIGHDFLQPKQLAFGFMLNLSESDGLKTGMMFGPSLTYKRNFETTISTIDLDIGLYSPLVFGFGINSNFNETDHLLGFKPFIGTSFYHMQLTYGYNFFRNSKNEKLKLSYHSVQFKLVLPLTRLKLLEY